MDRFMGIDARGDFELDSGKRGASALRRLRQRRWRRGFSLFGVLLALTLAAVTIVGAVSLYNAARESGNRSEALTLLNQLRANVESVYAGAPSYGNNTDLIATLDRRGGIPDGARLASGNTVQIRHPFGGLVSVTGGPGGTANSSASSSTTSTTRSARPWATRMRGAAGRGPGSSRSP